ncbi:transcription factor bHLH36-like [Quercus robur]|uniref:transcription factor bHLH36-like n=1 Tax=Quercus robur TaxID=38942 RepID=UPI002162FCDA|nr:transcription factor bHLH36-like [Quercus robur]
MSKGRSHKILATPDNNEENLSNNNERKIMRRDIERQRREQMASLYSSLRLLLPLEFIKGKRSASDLINEAANYIKHMTEKIQGLQVERDQLKNLSNSTAFIPGIEISNNCSLNYATVRVSEAGVEILMSSWLREEGFLLSKVLELLLEEGLSVIRCASNKTNQRLFLTIQSEVCDPTCFNLSELQQKLNAMCNYG